MDITPFSLQPSYDAIGAWGAWNLLVEAANALEFGFAKYRLPTPGKPISVDAALADVQRIQNGWQKEANIRDRGGNYSGAPHLTELPLNAQFWLHERLEEERRHIERVANNNG